MIDPEPRERATGGRTAMRRRRRRARRIAVGLVRPGGRAVDGQRGVRRARLQPPDRAGPDLPRAGPAGRADPRRPARAGAAGTRGQAGVGVLRAGQPAGPRGARPGADQGAGRDPRPAPADRRQDARAVAMAGRVLRLLLGPGARCRRAGGREEARGDAGRDVPGRPRGDARGPPRRADRAEALGEADRGAGDPLPRRRAADDVRRLPAGQVQLRAGPGAAEARAGAHRPPPAAGRPRRAGGGRHDAADRDRDGAAGMAASSRRPRNPAWC